MKNLLLLLSLFILTACIDPTGNLHVNEKLSLIHTTVFNNHKIVTVAAGDYNMTLTIKSNDSFKLKISGINKDIKIKTKRGISIPDNGSIFLPAADLGQKYDMQITMNTKTTNSDRRLKRETCDIVDYRTVCRSDSAGHTRCYQQRYVTLGRRDIEYYIQTVTRAMKLEMLLANSNIEAANFSGHDNDSHQINVWEGFCRRF